MKSSTSEYFATAFQTCLGNGNITAPGVVSVLTKIAVGMTLLFVILTPILFVLPADHDKKEKRFEHMLSCHVFSTLLVTLAKVVISSVFTGSLLVGDGRRYIFVFLPLFSHFFITALHVAVPLMINYWIPKTSLKRRVEAKRVVPEAMARFGLSLLYLAAFPAFLRPPMLSQGSLEQCLLVSGLAFSFYEILAELLFFMVFGSAYAFLTPENEA